MLSSSTVGMVESHKVVLWPTPLIPFPFPIYKVTAPFCLALVLCWMWSFSKELQNVLGHIWSEAKSSAYVPSKLLGLFLTIPPLGSNFEWLGIKYPLSAMPSWFLSVLHFLLSSRKGSATASFLFCVFISAILLNKKRQDHSRKVFIWI